MIFCINIPILYMFYCLYYYGHSVFMYIRLYEYFFLNTLANLNKILHEHYHTYSDYYNLYVKKTKKRLFYIQIVLTLLFWYQLEDNVGADYNFCGMEIRTLLLLLLHFILLSMKVKFKLHQRNNCIMLQTQFQLFTDIYTNSMLTQS